MQSYILCFFILLVGVFSQSCVDTVAYDPSNSTFSSISSDSIVGIQFNVTCYGNLDAITAYLSGANSSVSAALYSDSGSNSPRIFFYFLFLMA